MAFATSEWKPPDSGRSETVPLNRGSHDSDDEGRRGDSGSPNYQRGGSSSSEQRVEGAVYLAATRPRRGGLSSCLWQQVNYLCGFCREHRSSVLICLGAVLLVILAILVLDYIAKRGGFGCQWSDWSTWSYCSVACGTGHQSRSRVMYPNTASCNSVEHQRKGCEEMCEFHDDVDEVTVDYEVKVLHLNTVALDDDPSLKQKLEDAMVKGFRDVTGLKDEEVISDVFPEDGSATFRVTPRDMNSVKKLQLELSDAERVGKGIEEAVEASEDATFSTLGPLRVEAHHRPVVAIPHSHLPGLVHDGDASFFIGVDSPHWSRLQADQQYRTAVEVALKNGVATSASVAMQDFTAKLDVDNRLFRIDVKTDRHHHDVVNRMQAATKDPSSIQFLLARGPAEGLRLNYVRNGVVAFDVRVAGWESSMDKATSHKMKAALTDALGAAAGIESQEISVVGDLSTSDSMRVEVSKSAMSATLEHLQEALPGGSGKERLDAAILKALADSPSMANIGGSQASFRVTEWPVLSFLCESTHIDRQRTDTEADLRHRYESKLAEGLADAAGVMPEEVHVNLHRHSSKVEVLLEPENLQSILTRIRGVLANNEFEGGLVGALDEEPSLSGSTFGTPKVDFVETPEIAHAQLTGRDERVVQASFILRVMNSQFLEDHVGKLSLLQATLTKFFAEEAAVPIEDLFAKINPSHSRVAFEIRPKQLKALLGRVENTLAGGGLLNHELSAAIVTDVMLSKASPSGVGLKCGENPAPVITFKGDFGSLDEGHLQTNAKLMETLKDTVKATIGRVAKVNEEEVHLSEVGSKGTVTFTIGSGTLADFAESVKASLGDGTAATEKLQELMQGDAELAKLNWREVSLLSAEAPFSRDGKETNVRGDWWAMEGKHQVMPPLPAGPKGRKPVKVRLLPSWIPDLCMDLAGGFAKPGTGLWTWRCSQSRDMEFLLDLDPDTKRTKIRWATFPDFCLNAPGGTQLMVWPCEKSRLENIEFTVPENLLGPIRKAALPDQCVTIPPGKEDLRAWFVMETCDSLPAANRDFHVEVLDCAWGEWSDWSECSASCGGGERSRRARGSEAKIYDKEMDTCSGELRQSMPCNRQSCSEDESEELFQPMAVRLHHADNPGLCLAVGDPIKSGDGDRPGLPGMGDEVELRDCADSNLMLFLMPAQSYGRIRWREMQNSCLESKGKSVLLDDCNLASPSSSDWAVNPAGSTGSAVSICKAENSMDCLIAPMEGADHPITVGRCGGKHDPHCAAFQAQSVDCDWASWSPWSACSVPCGSGIRTRNRRHDTRTIVSCIADLTEEQEVLCNTHSCQR